MEGNLIPSRIGFSVFQSDPTF